MLFDVLEAIMKRGQRLEVLQWLGAAMNGNLPRATMGHRMRMRGGPELTSSDGFMLNVGPSAPCSPQASALNATGSR